MAAAASRPAKRPATRAARSAGLFAYARPYTPQLMVVALLVIVGTLATLAGPILFGRAIDEFIIPGDLPGLARIALIMLATVLVGGLAAIIYGVLMVQIAQRVVADIRAELFNHLQLLSMAYHDQHRVGDLMSRVTNDTEAINQVLSNGLIQFITNILMLGGIMVAMFLLNWQLAIGALDPAAGHALHHHAGHPAQPRRLPRSAALSGGDERRHGREYRRHSRGAGLRPCRGYHGPIRRSSTPPIARPGTKADIITAALGPMFTTMSTITIAATALLGGWLALQDIVTRGRDRHLCGLHHELLPPHAQHRHALQQSAVGAGRGRTHLRGAGCPAVRARSAGGTAAGEGAGSGAFRRM